MQFLAVVVLAALWAKGGVWIFEQNHWLLVPYVALGFVGGWFLQTDDEKNRMRAMFRRR